MRLSSPQSSLECYIVVPPQYRPQLYSALSFEAGTNLRAKVTFTDRKNENRIPLSSGRMDIYKRGAVRKDVNLLITGSDEDTEAVLQEIIDRNIPVYIYPKAGGGLQLNLPLVRSLGTDPLGATVTHTLTIATGTTIYMPRPDAGKGIFLEEVDTALPLVDGVWTSNGTGSQLPTGRGMAFFGPSENLLLNNLISAITYQAPYSAGGEWGAYTSASDHWGVDHGIKASPWCTDANSYWTKSATTTLRSYIFNMAGNTKKSLSFCYRVDGVMNVSLKDSGGTTRYSANITSGSGRAMIDLAGLASSYTGAYIVVALSSGSYCEFSCPQLIDSSTLQSSLYMPFLGTVSGTVKAAISAHLLTINSDMGADLVPFSTTEANRNGAVLISGYFQPMWGAGYLVASSQCPIVQAEGYDNYISLNAGYSGSGIEFTTYFTGTERIVAAVTGHVLGDIYAFGLWSGYSAGLANTQMSIVRLRDGATYGSSWLDGLVDLHTIKIGNSSSLAGSSYVISGVSVEAINYLQGTSAVLRLADASMRNIIRSTIGRWYTLEKATSPRAQMPYVSEGQYIGTEVRAI